MSLPYIYIWNPSPGEWMTAIMNGPGIGMRRCDSLSGALQVSLNTVARNGWAAPVIDLEGPRSLIGDSK